MLHSFPSQQSARPGEHSIRADRTPLHPPLITEAPLLHLEFQQIGFGTARRRGFAALVLIECIATFVQPINDVLAFLFFVVMFLETICEEVNTLRRVGDR
jgi:hypothetical protein